MQYRFLAPDVFPSPLAEGRELKLDDPSGFTVDVAGRPSRRGVN